MKPHPLPSSTSLLTSLLLLTTTPTVVLLVLAGPAPVPLPVPVPAADPLIVYHVLPLAAGTATAPTATTGTATVDGNNSNSSSSSSVGSYEEEDDKSIGAKIHALIFSSGGFEKRQTAATAAGEVEVLSSAHITVKGGGEKEEDREGEDWANWHAQWRRQQKQRRCQAWGACVRVY